MKTTVLRAALVLLTAFSFTYTRGANTHPYLYASKEKFISISNSSDSVVKELREIVIEEAEKALAEAALLCKDSVTDLPLIRACQGRILNLSAAYCLTKDKRYSEAAMRQISIMAGWEDLGTHHFLNVGEAALALGVAYDWLYPVLTADERRLIEQTLEHKAFAPYFEVTEETGTWLRGDFNWNQVCHGGMVVAALAVKDGYPDICRRVVERAIECVPYATAVYAPDGAYPEGPSYWEYGTTYQVLMMDAMRCVYGHSFDLEKADGFMKTADFRLQVCGNTGEEYGYSDYHKSFFNEPVMMWFARELGRYDLQEWELDRILKVHEAGDKLSRQTVFDLLWWSGLKPQEAPVKGNLQCWFARGEMPLAIMRTNKAHNDAYLAFKGGTANHSHGHMDSGSFIYESQGVRWALDLGTEVYDKMRQAGLDLWNYMPESTRWTTFRPSSEAHNILRVNGAPLVSTALASDMTFTEGGTKASATLDTTPLYATSPVSSVRRTVSLDQDGSLTVADELTATGDIDLTFQWITDADVTAEQGSVILAKDGKSIRLTCPLTDAVFIEDVSSVPGIQNSPNPGVKRVLFVKKVKAGQSLSLEVKASAQDDWRITATDYDAPEYYGATMAITGTAAQGQEYISQRPWHTLGT